MSNELKIKRETVFNKIGKWMRELFNRQEYDTNENDNDNKNDEQEKTDLLFIFLLKLLI